MASYLEIRHLRSLVAIAETGSVSQAARRVFLTQSALSHQLKSLEDTYKVPLFERRKGHALRPTAAGECLLRLAHDILPTIERTERELARLSGDEAGQLRIAVECHTCFDWLMPSMDAFRNYWPTVELDIVSGFQADPIGLLLTQRADLAIVSEIEENPNISYFPLFSYEMVGLAARNHPLANKKSWTAPDFVDETLITYPVPDSMLDIVRKVLKPAGITPARRTSELTIAIVQLVASRRGIAALPFWAIVPYLEKNYVVARSIGEGLYCKLYAAIRETETTIPFLTEFIKITQNTSFATLSGIRPMENIP